MSIVSSVAGWLITVVGSRVVEGLTDRAMQRIGLLDATCQRCSVRQRSIEVPERTPATLTCRHCGHQGTILIENMDTLTIHQVQFANIWVHQAQIAIQSTAGQPQGIRLPPARALASPHDSRNDVSSGPDLSRLQFPAISKGGLVLSWGVSLVGILILSFTCWKYSGDLAGSPFISASAFLTGLGGLMAGVIKREKDVIVLSLMSILMAGGFLCIYIFLG